MRQILLCLIVATLAVGIALSAGCERTRASGSVTVTTADSQAPSATRATETAVYFKQVENSPLQRSVWRGVPARAVIKSPLILTYAASYRAQPSIFDPLTRRLLHPKESKSQAEAITPYRGFANTRAREKV